MVSVTIGVILLLSLTALLGTTAFIVSTEAIKTPEMNLTSIDIESHGQTTCYVRMSNDSFNCIDGNTTGIHNMIRDDKP